MAENFYIASVTFSGASPERVAELFGEVGLSLEMEPPRGKGDPAGGPREKLLAKYGHIRDVYIIDGHPQPIPRQYANVKPVEGGSEVSVWTGSKKAQGRFRALLEAVASGDRLAAAEIIGALRLSPPKPHRAGA